MGSSGVGGETGPKAWQEGARVTTHYPERLILKPEGELRKQERLKTTPFSVESYYNCEIVK